MGGNWSLHRSTLSYHCEIDIRILTLRTISFFQVTASSATARFLIVFLNKYFNAQQLGFIVGSRRGFAFFASFIWGFLGDWTQRHLLCLISGAILNTVAINGFLFDLIYSNFYYTLILANFSTICGKSSCLFDAMVLLILGEKPKATDIKSNKKKSGTAGYGATRLWGAIGWGFGALICGALLAQFGEQSLIWFYDVTNSIPILIMIISSSYLSIKTYHNSVSNNEQNIINDDIPQQTKSTLNTKLFKKNICTSYGFLFLSNLLLFGICMSFVEYFLFLFLLDYFNATEFLCGMTIVLMVCGEVPMFYFSKCLLNKIGIIGLLSIAHIAYVIRCIGYTLLPQTPYYSWFILFIEPLHGLTFGGMWIASVEYGSKLAGKEMQGTMIGLISGVYQCLASSVGTMVGGVLYHHLGPVYMYRLSAVIIAGWMVFFQIALRIVRLCNNDDGIKLMFGEEICEKEEEYKKPLSKNPSVAEAPKMSLLSDDDVVDTSSIS